MAQISADEVLKLVAQGGVVDLSGKDLSGIELFAATLKSVKFGQADLTRANLFEGRPDRLRLHRGDPRPDESRGRQPDQSRAG